MPRRLLTVSACLLGLCFASLLLGGEEEPVYPKPISSFQAATARFTGEPQGGFTSSVLMATSYTAHDSILLSLELLVDTKDPVEFHCDMQALESRPPVVAIQRDHDAETAMALQASDRLVLGDNEPRTAKKGQRVLAYSFDLRDYCGRLEPGTYKLQARLPLDCIVVTAGTATTGNVALSPEIGFVVVDASVAAAEAAYGPDTILGIALNEVDDTGFPLGEATLTNPLEHQALLYVKTHQGQDNKLQHVFGVYERWNGQQDWIQQPCGRRCGTDMEWLPLSPGESVQITLPGGRRVEGILRYKVELRLPDDTEISVYSKPFLVSNPNFGR